jgi:hypothetical protein
MSAHRLWLTLAAAIVVLPILAACGGTSLAAQATPSPVASPSISGTPLTCAAGGPASGSWKTPDQMSGTTPPIMSAVVAGDTLTLTFVTGTPAFDVTTQPTAHFTATDGRGESVVLSGSSGVRIMLRGFRGDMQNYTGAKDFVTNGKTLVEVRELGDYEGVIGWAPGLTQPGCASVAASASTLTFTFFAS